MRNRSRRRRRFGSIALLTALLLLGGSAVARGQTCSSGWVVAKSANVSNGDNQLRGVDALGDADAWAVGTHWSSQGTRSLVEHWDGQTWSIVPSPNVGKSGSLEGVDAVARDDAWAVGHYGPASGAEAKTLIQHWDGSSWTVADSPNAGVEVGGNGWLADVFVADPQSVWAVGGYLSPDITPLIEHWDGATWSISPTPAVGGFSQLRSISGTGPQDIWAVGSQELPVGDAYVERPLVVHWDGAAWTALDLPVNGRPKGLTSVTAVAADDVWAVGLSSGPRRTRTAIMHWDGSTWSSVSAPSPSRTIAYLTGVSAVAADDVWAVGSRRTRVGFRTLVEHWDGSAWTVSSSESRGGDDLQDVAAFADGGFAVGSAWPRDVSERSLVLKWCTG